MTTYRTSNGIPIDLDTIRTTNEKTVSVGNMRVNARGDLLGPGGKIVKTAQQRAQEESKRKATQVNKSVSLKGEEPNKGMINDQETVVETEKKEKKQKATKKEKTTREVELEDGSIIIEDDMDGGV